jgi:plasmid stabilization system protein ParE
MTTTVIFTARARHALVRIAIYIAQDDERAAYRLVVELEDRVNDTLSVFPEAGVKAGAGNRRLTVKRHTVVYRYDPGAETAFVLNIHGAGQNWR